MHTVSVWLIASSCIFGILVKSTLFVYIVYQYKCYLTLEEKIKPCIQIDFSVLIQMSYKRLYFKQMS